MQARADDFSEHGIAAVERVRVQVPAACRQAIASPFRHGLIVTTRVEEPESGHRGLQSAVAPARAHRINTRCNGAGFDADFPLTGVSMMAI